MQRGNHRKHALLLRKLEARLKADQIIDRAQRIVLSELHNGVRLFARLRVFEADGLHRAVAERILAPARHDLNGHAALEDVLVLKAMHGRFLGSLQCFHKGDILVFFHRAVDIIRISAVIPRGEPRLFHVDRRECNEGRSRVKKAHVFLATEIVLNGRAHRVASQRARRDDDRRFRNFCDLFFDHCDLRMTADLLRHHAGKAVPVNGQRAAGFDAVCLRAGENQAL